MISVFCTETRLAAPVGTALEPLSPLDLIRDWSRFERAAPAGREAVIVEEWPGHETVLRIRTYRERSPVQPLVLVTARDADHLRACVALAIDAVVWTHEIHRNLAPAMERARGRGLVHELVRTLKDAAGLPPRLRQALLFAARAEVPCKGVGDLAHAVDCHRSTLSREWGSSLRAATGLRLEDFTDWLLVLAATRRKRPGLGWPATAHELGVHEHTLARGARRLAGVSLRELSNGGRVRAQERFRQQVLETLRSWAPHA